MAGKIVQYLKDRWVLVAVLLVFICLKIPHLDYPFYCDEGWVYIRAIKIMFAKGATLLPGTVEPDASRGHPLFMHFLCVVWMKCFGSSRIAIRVLPLLISVGCIISLYEVCLKFFGKIAAVVAILLVTTQIIFFVQASFVYPEVLVTTLALLALYLYATDRLFLTAITLVMLVLSKESGATFGAVMGIDALFALFRKEEKLNRKFARLAAVTTPVIAMSTFLYIQKLRCGWYIFPEHTDIIKTDWNAFYHMFRVALQWTYRGDIACYTVILFFVALSVIPAVRHKKPAYFLLLLPASIVYVFSSDYIINRTGDVIWVLLYGAFFMMPAYLLPKLLPGMGKPAKRFIWLLCSSVIVYTIYASLTLAAYRYNLVAIVLSLVFVAACAQAIIAATGRYLLYAATTGIALCCLLGIYTDFGNNDTDLEAYHAMDVQMAQVSFLEKENAWDKEIAVPCVWEMMHFTDSMEAFLNSPRVFERIKHFPPGPNTSYVIYDNICDGGDINSVQVDSNFSLAFRLVESRSWTLIYKRK